MGPDPSLLLSISENPLIVLLIVNIALLIFGMVMDTTAILLVAVPVLVPVMTALGVDPVHFGIIMVINLLIGTLTPPFGILLFVMSEVCLLLRYEETGSVGYDLIRTGNGTWTRSS